MQVTIDLPDDISEALRGQGQDLPQQALEALAIEGYRAGALTESQVRRLLGLDSRFDVHAILKNHGVRSDTPSRISRTISLPTASWETRDRYARCAACRGRSRALGRPRCI